MKFQIKYKIKNLLKRISHKIRYTLVYLECRNDYKMWDTAYKPKNIPFVFTCPYGNCGTHFPQFNNFTEEDLRKQLESAIKDSKNENSYFRGAYKNWQDLTELYQSILNILNKKEDFYFQIACDVLCENVKKHKQNYIRPVLYLSPSQGRILEFQPCCR